MEFICRISRDGGMDFGERNRVYFKSYLKAHPGVLLKITPVLPESDKQRRYLEGAVVPLATYYQEGMDHRNADDRASVREWLKLELIFPTRSGLPLDYRGDAFATMHGSWNR